MPLSNGTMVLLGYEKLMQSDSGICSFDPMGRVGSGSQHQHWLGASIQLSSEISQRVPDITRLLNAE